LNVDLVQFSFDLLNPVLNEEATDEIIVRTLDSCKRYGIKLQSCFTGAIAYNTNLLLHPSAGVRKMAFEWYARAIGIGGRLHAEDVGGHMGAFTVRDYRNPERREALLSEQKENVVALSELCAESGLSTLLWEIMPVPREPPSTISEARTLLQRFAGASVPVKLCIDVGHMCNPQATEPRDRDPYAWLRELGSDSPCVHVQQTDGKADRHWPFTEEFNRIGMIEGGKVLSSLDASGAGKAIIFPEVFPAFEQDDDQVIDDMFKTVKYWAEYL
jgi:sugar phosphate isomerase/epimerase